MKKYRVNKRSSGHAVEVQASGHSWRRVGSVYKHRNSAIERMRRLRGLADEEERSNVGQKVMSSRVFCKGVI